MPFQVSPGVNVSEIDLTTIVPAVSTSTGAFAGLFNWGPVEQAVLISTEDELVNTYGKPTANNFETFFTAANFLAYGNQLYVSRAANTGTYNAVANTSAPGVNTVIKNSKDFETQTSFDANNVFAAKYPGAIGNSLKIGICSSADQYSSTLLATSSNTTYGANTAQANVQIAVGGSNVAIIINCSTSNNFAYDIASTVRSSITVGDYLKIGSTTTGVQYLKVTQVNSITTDTDGSQNYYGFTVDLADTWKQKSNYSSVSNTTIASPVTIGTRYWEYFNSVPGAPGVSNYVASRTTNTSIADEAHIVVEDEDGAFTGSPGSILEVWNNVSRATDAKGEQGGSIYWRDVLDNQSKYVWSLKDYLGSAGTSDSFPTPSLTTPVSLSFKTGTDTASESTITMAALGNAYDVYKSSEDIDISLVLTGKSVGGSGEQLPNYLIDNIAENRRDCVVFVSPSRDNVVNVPGNELSNVVDFRNLLRSTSYAVMDSGYKYQYDKYNDVYRWVPLNGDIAGLCVRTDNIRDPWYSPAGFNRGNLKNIIKLAYNPDKADRDELYKSGVNPVVNFPGQGVVLYGDKTLLARPSAFDRINVRRLFIVLEKAISTAAKSTLFEFNDEFTRATFRNLVEPYLRDIQGRRGIYDFRVVCDTTNNTPEVIDRNEFRGDIYIKPARSINFIQLNFVAVRTGVEFEEIVGRF